MSKPSPHRQALLIGVLSALVALLVRWDFAVEQHPPELYLVHDMAIYQQQAEALVDRSRDAWDTFTPPGYPLFLALVGSPAGLGAIQALLGAVTAGLTALIAYRLDRSPLAALVAGLVCAVYAPLVFYTGLALTETLSALLLALFAALAMVAFDSPRRRALAIASGLCLGGVVLVRPSYLILVPLLAVVALRRRDRPDGRALGLVLGASVLVILPVALQTSMLLGRPALVASNGGVNFYLAHADCRSLRSTAGGRSTELSTHYSRIHLERACTTDRSFLDERHFYREGLGEIAERPGRLKRAFHALGEGLGLAPARPFPHQPFWPGSMEYEEALNAFSRAYFWLLLLPALLHAAFRWRRRETDPGVVSSAQRRLLWCVVGSVVVVLYGFNGNPRVRVSSDPIVIALAASALAALAQAASIRVRKRSNK